MHASLEQYLDSADGAANVMAHARLLLKLGRKYETIVPAGLRHLSRVANYKSGKIIIHADNGTVATKLRQMSTSLCQRLSQLGVECSVMEIKVQPREIPYQSNPSTTKPISAKAGATLNDRAREMPADSPLRAALQHLLERAAIRN